MALVAILSCGWSTTVSIDATLNAVKKLEDSGVDSCPVSKYNIETEELYKKMNSDSQQLLLVSLC